MKIIKVDNFNRDYMKDVLIAESVRPYYIKSIVQALNDKYSGEDSDDYFRSVEDDYELRLFDVY